MDEGDGSEGFKEDGKATGLALCVYLHNEKEALGRGGDTNGGYVSPWTPGRCL